MVVAHAQETAIAVGVTKELIPLEKKTLGNGHVTYEGTMRGKGDLEGHLTKVGVEYVADRQKGGTIQVTVHRANTKTGEVLDNYRAICEKKGGEWRLSAIEGKAEHADVSSWDGSIKEFAEKNWAWINSEMDKQA
jgi:hypothetical protein